MWERNLQDLVRGLRAHKNDEARFIASAIDEIRVEIRSEDMELKAGAVVKLTYLEMMGYDMSWASFHVVEVMSSPRFHLKSMGYLAATQSFEQDTDVLMLTTNLLKKDLTSANFLEVAVALNGLSHIVTPDLGRDLTRDLISLLTHSRAAIRKRAILAMYKVFLKYPEAIEYGMARLKERLEDPDIGVVSATVNILCELAKQDPKAYLPFAPPLFHLLTTSNNNWMLIKIIKLFGLLTPHEERLVRKLQPPITELISTTPAISLLYECVHTCITGKMLQGASGHSLAKTCVTKLAAFLEDSDQNLKYIALLSLTKIVPTHPHLVAEYESRILASIDDQDLSIRMRALDLISAMVDRNNLQSIVQQLLSHLVQPDLALTATRTAAESLANAALATKDASIASPTQSSVSYRTVLAQRILTLCGEDLYARVEDFEWYVSVLIDLAYVARAPVGALIRDQLVDIAVRVRQVRRYAVQICMRVLGDETFLDESGNGSDAEGTGCQEVLWAAAWICGEYSDEFSDTIKVLRCLLPDNTSNLSSDIIAVYLQSVAKVFGTWAVELASRWDEEDLSEVKEQVDFIISKVRNFATSPDFEVQELAANILQLFNFIRTDLASYRPKPKPEFENGFADASTSAFDPVGTAEPYFPKSLYLLKPLLSAYPLNPVASEAQSSVAVPEGMDLDAWIVPEAKPIVHELEYDNPGIKKKKKERKGKGKDVEDGDVSKKSRKKKAKDMQVPMTQEEIDAAKERAMAKARRLEMLRDDPYYIIDEKPKQQTIDVESIPVVRLDDLPPLTSVGTPSRNTTPSSLPSITRPSPSPYVSFTIDRGGEMPPTTRQKSPEPLPDSKPVEEVVSPWQPPEAYPAVIDYDEGAPSVTTPELIKVTRKKKTTSGKKKRPKDGGDSVQPTS